MTLKKINQYMVFNMTIHQYCNLNYFDYSSCFNCKLPVTVN